MGKNSQYKSNHSRKKGFRLGSIDVFMTLGDMESTIAASPEEAFAMMSMPALAGSIVKLVPNYELSEMPEEEN